ncbi:MAG: inositol monophosphatase [Ruminococcaceae bacterium]|nr:inositol monophosphatase [Oscillospiraceae bacterium]
MNYDLIIDLVKKAGKLALDSKLRLHVEMKGAADFVTEVDLKISDYLKKELAVLTPDIGFMSEEEKSEIQPRRWILDPIDGTTNLVYNYNMSSVSLALFDTDKVVFGVVHNPFNGETFTAIRGQGAWLNGEKLGNAPDRQITDSIIEFGAGSTHKDQAEQTFMLAKEVFEECLDLRRICSSALAICYIAAGRLNGYFEKVLKPWDYAAAVLLLEECGGKACDWQGNLLQYENPTSIICGMPKVAEFLLKKVSKYM